MKTLVSAAKVIRPAMACERLMYYLVSFDCYFLYQCLYIINNSTVSGSGRRPLQLTHTRVLSLLYIFAAIISKITKSGVHITKASRNYF